MLITIIFITCINKKEKNCLSHNSKQFGEVQLPRLTFILIYDLYQSFLGIYFSNICAVIIIQNRATKKIFTVIKQFNKSLVRVPCYIKKHSEVSLSHAARVFCSRNRTLLKMRTPYSLGQVRLQLIVWQFAKTVVILYHPQITCLYLVILQFYQEMSSFLSLLESWLAQ